MDNRLTREEFIKRANKVHNNKYDYSKVVYERCDKNVCIICPEHGEFWQTPVRHYYYKCGCPKCAVLRRKSKIYGVGINDMDNESNSIANSVWTDIIRRCYTKEMQAKYPSYIGCKICDDWKYLSNFKHWFDKHYVDGWQIDKDILIRGNKVYSPETCCFVPNDINTVLIKPLKKKCIYRGVSFDKVNNKYMARMSLYGKCKNLGRFNTPEEAFAVYKAAKEKYIKELADKHKEKLEPKVYEALYNYKIGITD